MVLNEPASHHVHPITEAIDVIVMVSLYRRFMVSCQFLGSWI